MALRRDADIEDVAAYLASVELPTQWPDFKPGDDALTRLTLMDTVMIIPRAAGNVDHGGALYQKECVACHARDGMGRGKFPRLVGQYSLGAANGGPRQRDEERSSPVVATEARSRWLRPGTRA